MDVVDRNDRGVASSQVESRRIVREVRKGMLVYDSVVRP